MNKLKMQTPNLSNDKFAALAEMFPNAVTETVDENGALVRAIDANVLAQEINTHVVKGKEERYQFTWPDKKKSVLLANTPIAATLRPSREESVNFDTTENLYIEGDNLDVLKLLRETYLNRVKMIYIDPPYNTGNDFVYNDEFGMENAEFLELDGQYDEDGNRMVRNLDSNGRFHTDWLNMIYPRLRVARDLLTDDGVIFISIDDNEVENLRKICGEIFGEVNFIGIILWKKKTNGNNMGYIPPVHDFILCYAKSVVDIAEIGYEISQEHIEKTYSNPDNDPRGAWTTMDLSANHKGPYFSITNPQNSEMFYPSEGRYWVFNEKEVQRRITDGRIIFGKSGNSRPVQKVFAAERLSGKIRAESWWDKHGMNEDATDEIRELFGQGKLFTHPKPSKLIYNLIKIATDMDSIILDFFSGSATTAHAVMQLNAEDGGKRKFIMVQLPEVTDENSEAYKAGYKNICEIGKERIRRAGDQILEISLKSLEKEGVIEKYDGELSKTRCLEKGDEFSGDSLSPVRKATPIGALQFAGSDEKSGNFNSVKHSGGASEGNKRVYPVSENSERLTGGVGNAAIALRTFEILKQYGYRISSEFARGNQQDVSGPNKEAKFIALNSKLSTDIGFRVLKLDSTNMKDVYYTPQATADVDIFGLIDNIKPDRTPEDLLFQVMLDLGILLSSKIEKRKIDGTDVFFVNDNYLIACFDSVTNEIMTKIAQTKPYYAVFRDSSFASDSTLVNFEQIFKTYSPTTERRIM